MRKEIVKRSFIGALFGDFGIETESEEDHVHILEHLPSEASNSESKFLIEIIPAKNWLLGFQNWMIKWSPSPSKVKALLKLKLTNMEM